MKRVVSLILCVFFISTLLFGCGTKKQEEQKPAASSSANTSQAPSKKEPTTIRFMSYIVTQENEKAFRDLVKEFNDTHPDIKVDLEMVPWSNYLDKLTTSVLSGSAPDGAHFKSMWLPTFQAQDTLAPIDEYVDKWKGKADVYDRIWDLYKTVSKDKKLYIMPYTLITSYVSYRKDLFDEAGVKAPETMDEFLAVAKKLTKDKDGDGKIDQYGYSMRANANGQGGWFGFAFANMKKPSFYQDGKLSFSTPEVIEANQLFVDLFKVHKVCPPTAPNDGTNENIAYLTSGKAAMMLHHVQTYAKIKAALGDKLGVFKMPAGKNGQRFSCAEETGSSIFKSSKNKEATFTFISWLVEKEQQIRFVKAGETLAYLKSLQDAPEVQNNPSQKISIESLAFSEFTPATPYMGDWTTRIWPATLQKAMVGQIDSKQMLEELEFAMFNKK